MTIEKIENMCGVKKRATPSTTRITEAIVSRTAQISNRNTSRAARRDNAKAKGATNIFSSIFISKTSFIYPSYLYFIMPARGHKCCERLVNPVPNLRAMMARKQKKQDTFMSCQISAILFPAAGNRELSAAKCR